MNIVCFDNHKRRDMDRIDLTVTLKKYIYIYYGFCSFLKLFSAHMKLFCPYHDAVRSAQATKTNAKQLHLVFAKHDLVRCEIVDVQRERDMCHVSLVENADNFVKLVKNLHLVLFVLYFKSV